MADVFLSYKSEDRALAANLARALEREGLSVWWDRKILAGGAWREAIAREIGAAKVVLAAWSKRTEDSAVAAWVLNEVDEAARLQIPIVPLKLEPCDAPFGYRHIQAADLSNWRGEANHPEWREVLGAVRGAIAGRRIGGTAPIAPTHKTPHWRARRNVFAALALTALLVGASYLARHEPPPAPSEEAAFTDVAAEASPEAEAEGMEASPPEDSPPEGAAEPIPDEAPAEPEPAPEEAAADEANIDAVDAGAIHRVAFVGVGVRGTFQHTRGDAWVERNSEAGQAGHYRALRAQGDEIDLYDAARDLWVRIDFGAGLIWVKNAGEHHYHRRYRIETAQESG